MEKDEKIFRQKEGFVRAERETAARRQVSSDNAAARGDETTAKRFAAEARNRLSRADHVEQNNKKP